MAVIACAEKGGGMSQVCVIHDNGFMPVVPQQQKERNDPCIWPISVVFLKYNEII
jgi:hypothetical protein